MLNFGMPPGFAEALAMKYGIMKMQADAQSNALNSAANLDTVKAGLLPKQTNADIGETQARTANIAETTKTIAPESKARVGLLGAQTSNYDANTGYTTEQTVGLKQLNKKRPFGLGLGGSNDNNYGFGGYGFSFGS
jgi:hypothetical protein